MTRVRVKAAAIVVMASIVATPGAGPPAEAGPPPEAAPPAGACQPVRWPQGTGVFWHHSYVRRQEPTSRSSCAISLDQGHRGAVTIDPYGGARIPPYRKTGAGAGPRPGAAQSAAVPLYREQLRNDCEASALRMVLAARGHQVGVRAVLKRIGVDRVHSQAGRSGPRAGNPFRAFVGDPNGSQIAGTGFGVYYPPIARVARSYDLVVVKAGQGISPAEIRTQVSRGHPAIVWVDYLWRRKKTRWYRAHDGRLIPYAGPAEHAVVVSKFARGRVLINDSARGRYWVTDSAFNAGYATYKHMAVIVR